MLSKSQINLLKSLQHKKFRREHGLFLVEGYKSVKEFVNSAYQIQTIYHTQAFDPKMLKLSQKIAFKEISLSDLEKISNLQSARDVIATVKTPHWTTPISSDLQQKFTLVLDGLQDPGNVGTIIRTADWFGLNTIVCSEDTVDVYNPKVVQATMGSLARVKVHYEDLTNFLTSTKLPVFGAQLHGESIFKADFGTEGIVVLGSEGEGISGPVQKFIINAVTIPRIGQAESLNVAVAAAIFCAEATK